MYFRYLSYFKKKRFYRHKRHIAVNNFAVMNNIGIRRVRANKVYLAIVNCGKITRVTLSFFRRMVKLTLEIQFVFCNFNRFRVYVDFASTAVVPPPTNWFKFLIQNGVSLFRVSQNNFFGIYGDQFPRYLAFNQLHCFFCNALRPVKQINKNSVIKNELTLLL